MSDIIRLNVGGQIFCTSWTTLQQSEPNSSLALMFSTSSPHKLPVKDNSGAYMLDSSPAYFGTVLDWCRYKRLMVPEKFDLAGLEVVADYFNMTELGKIVKNEMDIKKATAIAKYTHSFELRWFWSEEDETKLLLTDEMNDIQTNMSDIVDRLIKMNAEILMLNINFAKETSIIELRWTMDSLRRSPFAEIQDITSKIVKIIEDNGINTEIVKLSINIGK